MSKMVAVWLYLKAVIFVDLSNVDMSALMVFMMVLVLCFYQGKAGSNLSNVAKVKKEHLGFSSCNSCNSIHLCDNSSTKSGASPFASHKLPGGMILDLCLEPIGGLSSQFFTSSGVYSRGGLEVMEVERKLNGNGAHRELASLLTVRLEKSKTCHMVIVERLSSGVFADMFELEGLVARGAYESAVIYGDHNLELPALHSLNSIVVLQTSFTSESEHLFQAKVSLPLHARYPPLSLESHAAVDLKFPYFLFQCSYKGENASAANIDATTRDSEDKPAWALLTGRESIFLDLVKLQWLVPAGNPQHSEVVAAITACTSLVGVVILWVVSKRSYDSQKFKLTRDFFPCEHARG